MCSAVCSDREETRMTAEEWHAEQTAILRSQLVADGAIDDSIAESIVEREAVDHDSDLES